MLSKDLVMAIHQERLREAESARRGRRASPSRTGLTALLRPAGGTPPPRQPERHTPTP
jgi:hypothetical protein